MSIMALGLAAFCFTGCVSKKQYAELQANNSTLQSQNAALQSELNDARVRIAEYTSDSKSLAARLAEEQQDVDVQVLKGVVYISLADNMLYKSGSYEIGDRAGETLSKIAKIITDYPDYDVLVEGNTDNVPIKRENIRNNWDLSTLRASSVVQALINDYGVEPKRLTAGGRGEFNPVASNLTEKGRQRNRRTQIIITPKLDQFLELIDQAPEEE